MPLNFELKISLIILYFINIDSIIFPLIFSFIPVTDASPHIWYVLARTSQILSLLESTVNKR